MIRWTSAGAVGEPQALQVRLGAEFPGRIAANAPTPSRDLSIPELRKNLAYFTADRGPRQAPCTTLVLGGLPPEGHPTVGPLVEALSQGRAQGIGRVVAHLSGRRLPTPLTDAVDAVVTRIEAPQELAWLQGPEGGRLAVIVLTRRAVEALDALVEALCLGRAADQVLFTWPWSGAEPPLAMEAAAAVREPLVRLEQAGIAVGVKGIPLCTLAPGPGMLQRWEARVWRSTNRFYVDADHQQDRALLVFPDLVRFAKAESCRFCTVSARCDGVVEGWFRQGLAGPLVPFSG